MTSSVSNHIEARLPPTGTVSWWLLYLLAPVSLVVLGLALVPELVYDRYIWQYLWGPVVADGAGEPVTHEGIRAVKGYNPVNTITYVTIMLYALPGVREFFTAFDIDLDVGLAYGLAPILVAGGVMRALEDAELLFRPLNLLFITPPIYFTVAAITTAALLIGVLLRQHFDSEHAVPLACGTVGTVWSIAGVVVALSFGLGSGRPFRPLVPVATVGIAALFVAGFYLTGDRLDRRYLQHPLTLLLVFGQMLDAAQNLLGVTFFGYTPKLFITQVVYEATNFSGSTFLLKFAAVALIVWTVGSGDEDLTSRWSWIILFVATAVGLPQGVRGMLRVTMGV
ncbi:MULTISPECIES: DUF63 family protein [unclassified Haloferax]|jgi:uncharacterized membrane protein|uniref:DUF63 family protein n=1 Tax=unclassified Haloferax TaxID=2625095 RepID=UPI00287656EE|nr:MULTISPECIES: DUF63 family protein [unclassified Haloferax]MDS0241350.1 DUF63 family protein [Haloferax sp. S2CR25]MDS0444471.1 DUF63 family protein [Haloferax sp. S2CR25-2]